MASASVDAVQIAVERALTDEEDDSFEKIDYLNQPEPTEEEQKQKFAKLEGELANARRTIEYYSKKCLAPPALIIVLISVVFMCAVLWHILMYGACASVSPPPDVLSFFFPYDRPADPAQALTFECPKIPECPAVPKCELAKREMRLCPGEKRILLQGGSFNLIGNVVKSVSAVPGEQSVKVGQEIQLINGKDTRNWAGQNISRTFTVQEGDELEVVVRDPHSIKTCFFCIGWVAAICLTIAYFPDDFTISNFTKGLIGTSPPTACAQIPSEGASEELASDASNDDSDCHSDDDQDEEDEQESESEDDNDEAEDKEENASEDDQQIVTENNEMVYEDDQKEGTVSEVIDQQAVAIEDNKVELEMFQTRVASAHVDWMVLNAQVEMLKKTRDELIKKNAELEEMHKAPSQQRTWLEQTLDESLVPENGG